MSHALMTHPTKTSIDPHPSCDHRGSDRERLLHAARQAGLEPNDVVRLAEALTGHSWDRCGRFEISLTARALLEASSRAVPGPGQGVGPCAG
jgi:hypothetical protein